LSSLVSRITHKAKLIWDVVDPSPLGLYRRLSRPVDGWLTRDEESLLFHKAQVVPREQCIVELGSWFGRSAILLGGGTVHGHGARVFAVDLFTAAGCAKEALEERAGDAAKDFLELFQANLQKAKLKGIVTAVRSVTAELGQRWDGPPVGLLFIDADHSYEGVQSDWNAWKHGMASGATVAFHDYQNPAYEGVTRFVDELLADRVLRSVERHDSILCGEVIDGQPAR
jgi:hypothetical protein